MPASIRRPAVAGRFYPADSGRLTAFMEEHLIPEATETDRTVRAVIVPHAGYPYSGDVAAKAFAQVDLSRYQRAIVMGPSHHIAFRGLCAAPHDTFQTPLGEQQLDREACDELAKGDHRFNRRQDIHEPEHCLEVELPFLQYLAPHLSLIPLVCGQMTMGDIDDIAERLLAHWDEQTLLVVSSDFTHYGYDYMPFGLDDAPRQLPELDGGAIEAIKQLDCEAFMRYVEETGATICGRFPIAVMLRMIERQQQEGTADLLDYTNSGQITGDYSYAVGYAGIAYRN